MMIIVTKSKNSDVFSRTKTNMQRISSPLSTYVFRTSRKVNSGTLEGTSSVDQCKLLLVPVQVLVLIIENTTTCFIIVTQHVFTFHIVDS